MFDDPSGRRWRRVRTFLVVGVVAALVLAGLGFTWSVTAPGQQRLSEATMLQTRPAIDPPPVVGSGPVQRVLGVERGPDGVWAVDPLTRERVQRFTDEEARTIGSSTNVTLLTGYDGGPEKTIALTFDDGPDPIVTPELLDVLSAEQVPATFFVIGKNVVKNPEIARRIVAEGHTLGGHTMTHPDLTGVPQWRSNYELASTERLIRATTGVATNVWRQPYDGGQLMDDAASVNTILAAEQQGYRHAGYDFDTKDWQVDARPGATAADIPLPDFSDQDHITVLLHDAGGPHREITVAYVRDYLIPAARENGFTFTAMHVDNVALAEANTPVAVGIADRTVLAITKALYVWPNTVMFGLFAFSVVLAVAAAVLNIVLAVRRRRSEARIRAAEESSVPRLVDVSVLLAAYNEEKVIERTLRAVLASHYPIREIMVVDDGSTDSTAERVRALAATDERIRLAQQPNRGKSAALNHGLRLVRGCMVVTIDADTLVTPQTIAEAARVFARDTEGRVGVVAGAIRVGNHRTNILTRWQALEYVTQVGIDRAAQAALQAIAIVPGACAAWRREAIIAAGGFKTDNLAEDAELALTMHELGWKVDQADAAVSYTEAPTSVDDLLKQRVRWTYGIMQAMWKHRGLLGDRRHPGLGFYVFPMYVLGQFVPFLFLPGTVVVTFLLLQSGAWLLVAGFFVGFVVYQLLLSSIAVRLQDADPRQLWIVPLYRLIYEPMRAYLLYATALCAVKGVRVRWNRVTRTGTVHEDMLAHDDVLRQDQVAVHPVPAPVRQGPTPVRGDQSLVPAGARP